MTVWGFCQKRCKKPVYTVEEVNELLKKYVSNENDNEEELSFSTNGKAKIVRRGKVVTVYAHVEVTAGQTVTMSNKVALPEWAKPSESLYYTDSSGSEYVRSVIAQDMNLKCTGYLQIVKTSGNLAFIFRNTDTVNPAVLHLTLSYVVD